MEVVSQKPQEKDSALRVLRDTQFMSQHIRDHNGTCLYAALPFVMWQPHQTECVWKWGPEYQAKLQKRQNTSLEQINRLYLFADEVLSSGGEICIQWPKDSTVWLRPEVVGFVHKHDLILAVVDTCACGDVETNGKPIQHSLQCMCSSERQAVSLDCLRCHCYCDVQHAGWQNSMDIPKPLGFVILSSWYGHHNFAPALPCGPVMQKLSSPEVGGQGRFC